MFHSIYPPPPRAKLSYETSPHLWPLPGCWRHVCPEEGLAQSRTQPGHLPQHPHTGVISAQEAGPDIADIRYPHPNNHILTQYPTRSHDAALPCRHATPRDRTDLHILSRFPEEESAQLRPLVVLNVQQCGGKLEIVQRGKYKCLWHQAGYCTSYRS